MIQKPRRRLFCTGNLSAANDPFPQTARPRTAWNSDNHNAHWGMPPRPRAEDLDWPPTQVTASDSRRISNVRSRGKLLSKTAHSNHCLTPHPRIRLAGSVLKEHIGGRRRLAPSFADFWRSSIADKNRKNHPKNRGIKRACRVLHHPIHDRANCPRHTPPSLPLGGVGGQTDGFVDRIVP